MGSNHVNHFTLAPASTGTSLTASDIPIIATQMVVTIEVAAARWRADGTAASTGATGGMLLLPGDVLDFRGNDFQQLIKRSSFATVSATATVVIDLFDGYDRA